MNFGPSFILRHDIYGANAVSEVQPMSPEDRKVRHFFFLLSFLPSFLHLNFHSLIILAIVLDEIYDSLESYAIIHSIMHDDSILCIDFDLFHDDYITLLNFIRFTSCGLQLFGKPSWLLVHLHLLSSLLEFGGMFRLLVFKRKLYQH